MPKGPPRHGQTFNTIRNKQVEHNIRQLNLEEEQLKPDQNLKVDESPKAEENPQEGQKAQAGKDSQEDESPDKKANQRLKYEIVGFAMKLAFAAIILSVLTTFVFGFERIENRMMFPSIQPGDLTIYYRLAKEYKYADIVAIKEDEGKNILRVIGVPGDIIDINDQGLLLNNAILSEDYKTGDTLLFPSDVQFPLKLGDNELFVLGDRREESKDSRFYGPVPFDHVEGKVIFVFRGRQNSH